MAGRNPQVDEYLENLEPKRREALTELRSLILETAPQAQEAMMYRMPTYHLGDAILCAFASQKQYMSLYVETDLVEKHRDGLVGLSVGKSCIRFRRLEQMPKEVARMILTETVERLANRDQ